jgi:uncharacterized protein
MAAPLDGAGAVRLGRETLAIGLAGPERGDDPAGWFRGRSFPAGFEERRGVFVTLTTHPGERLRGCIGFPMPIFPLRSAIPRAAWAAAREDPRFPPVEADELARIALELSILTVPTPIPPGADRARSVRVGRDGLIVETSTHSGLLLPQVAAEEGWDAERFLAETCRKAGLPVGAWRLDGTRVRTFQAELFRERAPGGPVEAHALPSARADGIA